MVEDLLDSPVPVREIFAVSSLEDDPRAAAVLHRARLAGVDRVDISEVDVKALSATETSQGLLAIAEIPGAVLADVLNRVPRLILVLDAVQDPGNFGTLTRSAEALGAGAVVTLPGTVDPWNPKSVRAAAGSSFRLPVVEGDGDSLESLRTAGYRILGADMEGRDVSQVRAGRVALVLGNEGAGLSAAVRGAADELVSVPIRGRAESLNVAAAAAILMYELLR